MTKEQSRVKDWMRKFGQDCPDKPTQIDEKTAILRAKLILEEALETISDGLGIEVNFNLGENTFYGLNPDDLKSGVLNFRKFKEVDLIEVADGISDLMVVGEGTAVACGIDTEPVHSEVLLSNDSKLWTHDEIASLTKMNFPTSKVSDDERGFLVKDLDGKVQKSPSYYAANISQIIEEQSK